MAPELEAKQDTKQIKAQLLAIGDQVTDIDLTTISPAKMRKTDNPFPRAMKVQTYCGRVNLNYDEVMGEGYTAESRSWGEHVPGTCLIEHKGMFYVHFIVIETGDPRYIEDGHSVPVECLEPFLYPPSEQPVRDIKLTNIESLRIIT